MITSFPPHKSLEKAISWSIYVAIICLALWIRTIYLWNDLPANRDVDEPYYFMWGEAVKNTGVPNVASGTGYPPGVLYLFAFEQKFLEKITPLPISVREYIGFARTLNALLSLIALGLVITLTKKVGGSWVFASLGGLFTALWPVISDESRRANSSTGWLVFSLLVFFFLFIARKRQSFFYLYLALFAGLISMLFKYQTLVLLVFPFIFSLELKSKNLKQYLLHNAIWLALLSLTFIWLVADYGVLDLLHHPNNPARSISPATIFKFQSLEINLQIILKAAGGMPFLILSFIALISAIYAVIKRTFLTEIKASLILALAMFCVNFYTLMSFFAPYPAIHNYWLPLISGVHILALVGGAISIRFFLNLSRNFLPSQMLKMTGQLITLTSISVASFLFVKDVFPYWEYKHRETWAKPFTAQAMNDWFIQNVPQGGRTMAERVKMPFSDVYLPIPFHRTATESLFLNSVEEYRRDGYEYLIWNNLKSTVLTDQLEDLNSEKSKKYFQGTKEVLRLTGPDYFGTDIVIFEIPPLQQYPLYLWFSSAISFRGYDLDKTTFKSGENLQLTLYWMSAQKIKNNYIVFIHLQDEEGKLIAGQDGPPVNGIRPTWSWEGDMQFITDKHTIPLPPDIKPGRYTLVIGMYDAGTQERVSVFDLKKPPIEANAVTLQQIQIEK